MSQEALMEVRLEALGTELRARPRVSPRVLEQLRAASDVRGPRAIESRLRYRPRWGHRLVAAGVSGSAIVCLVVAAMIAMAPSPVVGWAEVTAALSAQPWIRGRVVAPASRQATMWLSPSRRLWAFDLGESCYFYDGAARKKYEYRRITPEIVKLPLGEDAEQNVLPLAALAADQTTIGPWLLGTEKIVAQERHEVVENGKKWIDFHLKFWRGAQNQAVLRVDPDTRLPVYLLTVSPTNPSQSSRWEFDYPATGPTDIYALGVPREAQIVDQMPEAAARNVLDAMAASRARIGDFRLIIGRPAMLISGQANDDCQPQLIVSRKGGRWRIDQRELNLGRAAFVPPPPRDADWQSWLVEQVRQSKYAPQVICDGGTVWENIARRPGAPQVWERSKHTAPQDLMSGEGSGGGLPSAADVRFAALVYPDLSPKAGWIFEFDPAPVDAPGCVLIKREARLATRDPQVGHEWYYIDPAKGHAVVRIERFNLPPDVPTDPKAAAGGDLVLLEGFQLSRQGCWYPTVVRETSAPAQVGGNKQAAASFSKTVRYAFDFEAELPNELFVVEGANGQ